MTYEEPNYTDEEHLQNVIDHQRGADFEQVSAIIRLLDAAKEKAKAAYDEGHMDGWREGYYDS